MELFQSNESMLALNPGYETLGWNLPTPSALKSLSGKAGDSQLPLTLIAWLSKP